jgi:WD40 repeat protein
VVSVAEEGSHLWDVRSGRELAILPPAFCVEPTPAGQLLTCALDGSIGILSADGTPLGSIPSGTLPLGALALDEPGERVLAAGDDTVVKYWSLADRRLLRTLEGHTSNVYDVDIAPGGKLAATAGNDRSVRIWDLETGKTLKLLEHGGPAISVQFSPDGRRLATVSADRTLRVWDVTPDERSPADLLELVACRVPFRVEGGQAVHFSVFPQRCPDRL